MLRLRKQGLISHWFSGFGQEAISVGAASALRADEYILPLYRNGGVFTTRGVPLMRILAQFQGKPGGFTKGRDRTFHFGSHQHHIVGMISHLGPQLSVACGIALGQKLRGRERVTLVFCGDGGVSEGEFHEALNLAAVWALPVIFLIENNSYAFSTPAREQYLCERISERAAGYGVEGLTIDGNDVLEVHDCISSYAAALRARPRPVLIECITFRMRPHEEASRNEYVPAAQLEYWRGRDPVRSFEQALIERGVVTPAAAAALRSELQLEIESAIEKAFAEPARILPDAAIELRDVYAAHGSEPIEPAGGAHSRKKFIHAISEGLRQAMQSFDNLVLIGNDIAEYGGAFRATEGLLREFGKDRVRNAPLCESAMVGAGLGLAISGMKSVVEIQYSDFVSCAFTQVVNNLAKTHYRWGQAADVVLRLPVGGELRAGPFHSQSCEAWFMHTPGLKIVYPSSPYDAKGLLLAAIEDPNPVLFFEHKKLYHSLEEPVPDEYYNVEIGKARLVLQGSDVSVITYGLGVQWALEAMRNNDIDGDLLDLRSLQPLDYEAIRRTVNKTGRVIILHEATLTAGAGAEVAACIARDCFDRLDAPIVRSASLDTPIPYAAELEDNFLAHKRFEQQLIDLLLY